MSTALARIDAQTQAALQKYASGNYNVLLPTPELGQIAQMHAMKFEVVNLNPDPKGGDFYAGDGGQLRPTKLGLEKISSLGGIQWNYRESGEVTVSTCAKCLKMAQATGKAAACAPCDHREDYAYKAVGAVRKPSGDWIPLSATYELDFVALKAEKSEKEISSIRRHRVARAETGAQERVIRKLMHVKNSYTREEAARPFVVPRIDLALDYSDPMVKQALLARSLSAQTALFGGSSGDTRVIDITTGEVLSPPLTALEPVATADTRPDPAPEIQSESFEPDPEVSSPSAGEGVTYLTCACGAIIEPSPDWPIPKIQEWLTRKYGKVLCATCRRAVPR